MCLEAPSAANVLGNSASTSTNNVFGALTICQTLTATDVQHGRATAASGVNSA